MNMSKISFVLPFSIYPLVHHTGPPAQLYYLSIWYIIRAPGPIILSIHLVHHKGPPAQSYYLSIWEHHIYVFYLEIYLSTPKRADRADMADLHFKSTTPFFLHFFSNKTLELPSKGDVAWKWIYFIVRIQAVKSGFKTFYWSNRTTSPQLIQWTVRINQFWQLGSVHKIHFNLEATSPLCFFCHHGPINNSHTHSIPARNIDTAWNIILYCKLL